MSSSEAWFMKISTGWKLLHWNAVKAIANNNFTRIVGLIPIAGYLILFNDEIAHLATFNSLAGVGKDDVSPFVLGGLTKLRMVFFGSLSVLCSYIVYRVFRPEILETANTELEFAELVRHRYSVHELKHIEEHIHSADWTERTEAFWTVLGERRSKKLIVSGYRPDARNFMFSKHGDYISFLAREWWTGMMHTYPFARASSAILAVAGYTMMAVPTLDISQAVLRHLLAG